MTGRGYGDAVSILDTIDGALHDYEASGNAMRWVREEKRKERPHLLPLGGRSIDMSITIDTSEFEAAMRRVGDAFTRLAEEMRPFIEAQAKACAALVKAMAPTVKVLNEVRAARVSAMHREYRRRSNARRRRKR